MEGDDALFYHERDVRCGDRRHAEAVTPTRHGPAKLRPGARQQPEGGPRIGPAFKELLRPQCDERVDGDRHGTAYDDGVYVDLAHLRMV